MITLPGQLAIKTAHGRYGDFNVGYLTTSIGEFVIKDAQLDQYKQGKYDGDFTIEKIRPWTYSAGGRMVIEIRAVLEKMTLSSSDALSKDEAQRLTPQEVDPIEEQPSISPPVQVAPAPEPPVVQTATTPVPTEQPKPAKVTAVKDTRPFAFGSVDKPEPAKPATSDSDVEPDAKLFGALYPLGLAIKLDATVDRRLLRQQRDRLEQLGYALDYRTQEFRRAA